jgi:hypothetical protein
MAYDGGESTREYGSKLTSWLAHNGIHDKDLVSYFMSNDVSKDAKYEMAQAVKKGKYKMNGGSPGNGGEHHDDALMHLVPYAENDGSVTYVDRMSGNVVVSIRRQDNGLYSFFGRKAQMEMLGGRGLMSQINRDMSDGDLFHDKK